MHSFIDSFVLCWLSIQTHLTLHNKTPNSVAVRIMEGRLLDFDDQGYVPTPQKGEGGAAAAGQRRRREQKLEGRELLYPSSSAMHQEGGQQLRRRHVEASSLTASPIPPAIAPIGVAPASAGGGGGK